MALVTGWETLDIMRILASNPDTIGDLVLRQPLYEALSKTGLELMLIVRSTAASVARLVAPSAQIIYLNQNPYSPRFAASGNDLSSVFEAARQFQPNRLLVAPYHWTVFEERLAENLPDATVHGMSGGLLTRGPQPHACRDSRLAIDQQVDVSENLPELRKNELLCSAILGRQINLPNPVLRPTSPQIQAGEAQLARMGMSPGEFWVARVGDTALTAIRNWQVDSWGHVLGEWVSRYNRSFVFIGKESERPTTMRIHAAMGKSAARSAVAMGKDADSDTMLGLIYLSKGYIGRETGPMHVAAAFGKPVIALLGGGAWPRFVPACDRGFVATVEVPCTGCHWTCPFAESYCVKQVPTDEIMKGIDLLESGRLESKQVRVLQLDRTLASRMVVEAARTSREHVRRLSALEQREAKPRSKLVETCDHVTMAESKLVDTQVEMAQLRADQTVAMQLVNQKSQESAQLQEQNAQFQAQVAQLQEQNAQLREQGARLQGLAAVYQQHVRDLQKSRWRRVGLRIGIAKKADWEHKNSYR